VTTVHVVLPEGVDDPARRSGGNVYDRRICDGLRTLGWQVRERQVPGAWPSSTPSAHAASTKVLASLDDGEVVLIDGLIACGSPGTLVLQASRLRLAVLVHLPLGLGTSSADVVSRERAVLSAATAVITTSDWSRRWLLGSYGLDEGRVHVAEPGVDEAPPARGTSGGGELLCVAAVAPHKGQDLLLAALQQLPDLAWRCLCVGSRTRDRAFTAELSRAVATSGLADRFVLAGNRWGTALEAAYAAADVLVLPSRMETYGLVVTEALARGLPVIGSDVGGVAEALGGDGCGHRPGVLTPPANVGALADALRHWLLEPTLRDLLRARARRRRSTLRRWETTASEIATALELVARRSVNLRPL
jgi:glycosyltransferase involved in cell wall biosynthesis